MIRSLLCWLIPGTCTVRWTGLELPTVFTLHLTSYAQRCQRYRNESVTPAVENDRQKGMLALLGEPPFVNLISPLGHKIRTKINFLFLSPVASGVLRLTSEIEYSWGLEMF